MPTIKTKVNLTEDERRNIICKMGQVGKMRCVLVEPERSKIMCSYIEELLQKAYDIGQKDAWENYN